VSTPDERLFELELRRQYDGKTMDVLQKAASETAKDVAEIKLVLRDVTKQMEGNCKANTETRKLLTDTVMPALANIKELKNRGSGLVMGLGLAGVGSSAVATTLIKLLG